MQNVSESAVTAIDIAGERITFRRTDNSHEILRDRIAAGLAEDLELLKTILAKKREQRAAMQQPGWERDVLDDEIVIYEQGVAHISAGLRGTVVRLRDERRHERAESQMRWRNARARAR